MVELRVSEKHLQKKFYFKYFKRCWAHTFSKSYMFGSMNKRNNYDYTLFGWTRIKSLKVY